MKLDKLRVELYSIKLVCCQNSVAVNQKSPEK